MNDFIQLAMQDTGRKIASDEVNRLYLDGQVKKAERKALEYNAKVDEKLRPYYDEHKDWADELADELNPNLYIKIAVQNGDKNAKANN